MPEDEREPIQRAAEETDYDLYDVVSWENRTWVDRIATSIYGGLLTSARAVVILLAVLIVVAQFALTGVAAIQDPVLAAYILLSVVPALALTGYVWKVDVTMKEPLEMLVVTFLLGFLFAGFAAVFNTLLQGFFQYIPLIGMILFFYLVVAPVEEIVKWLAIRLYAYRSDEFDAVIDGAVYGAVAGLGFATIENTIYITQPYLQAAGTGTEALRQALQTAAVRSFAGPGHVIYSAFAGYYLGLAKFNPENRGPIIVKGLLIAAFIHGTYNSLVSNLGVVVGLFPGLGGLGSGVLFVGFVLVYDGVFFYILYRKLSRYRQTFVATNATEYYDEVDQEDIDVDEESLDTEARTADETMGDTAQAGEGGFIFESEEQTERTGKQNAEESESTGNQHKSSEEQPETEEKPESAEDQTDPTEDQSGETEDQSGEE